MATRKKKSAPPTELRISLNDPGMTPLHKAGLAGLAMTLERLRRPPRVEWGWDPVGAQSVRLFWGESGPDALLEFLFCEGLALDEATGLVDFPALRGRLGQPASYEERWLFQRALTGTFLKQSRSRKLGDERFLVLDPDSKHPPVSYRPMTFFRHQDQHEALSKRLAKPTQKGIRFVGWLVPGAVEKHPGTAQTRMSQLPGPYLALCFAPVGSLCFLMRGAGSRGYALVLPEINDLKGYARFRRRFTHLTAEQLYVAGSEDAAMLVALSMHTGLEKATSGPGGQRFCQAIEFRRQIWNSKEPVRTSVIAIKPPDARALHNYRLAWSLSEFQTRRVRTKDGTGTWFATSPSRGAIAKALGEGRAWWEGVAEVYRRGGSDVRAAFEQVLERKGLNIMVKRAEWDEHSERRFVEACHEAMRHLYGSIGGQTREAGTGFEQKARTELVRIRSSLLRAKNAESFRSALMDFWARASRTKVRSNPTLRGTDPETGKPGWYAVLPLLRDDSWTRARDLALLALISYSGKTPDDDDDAVEPNED